MQTIESIHTERERECEQGQERHRLHPTWKIPINL